MASKIKGWFHCIGLSDGLPRSKHTPQTDHSDSWPKTIKYSQTDHLHKIITYVESDRALSKANIQLHKNAERHKLSKLSLGLSVHYTIAFKRVGRIRLTACGLKEITDKTLKNWDGHEGLGLDRLTDTWRDRRTGSNTDALATISTISLSFILWELQGLSVDLYVEAKVQGSCMN